MAGTKKQFGKRTYRSVGEFLADVWFVLRSFPGMVRILRRPRGWWTRPGRRRPGATNIMLRMMRAGNLTGNTWDYILYRVSFGRLGMQQHPRAGWAASTTD